VTAAALVLDNHSQVVCPLFSGESLKGEMLFGRAAKILPWLFSFGQ